MNKLLLVFVGIVLFSGYFLIQMDSSKDIEDKHILSDHEHMTEEEKEIEKFGTHGDSFDIHTIPLGDGKISDSPKAGYVFSCQTNFREGVTSHGGDWIDGDTWDVTKKLAVIGEVNWEDAFYSEDSNSLKRIISANGLPVDYPTGNFPIARNDPAYLLDRNPNGISEQNVSYTLPLNPIFTASPFCVPMGAIGVALNGVAIYNALDDAGEDAVAHEVQDTCNGHPQKVGEYHYHGPSDCIEGATRSDTLIGYALDGFGIYSKFDAEGNRYTNEDLDECHGMTSSVLWNGKVQDVYHYVMTEEYPYTLGCFKGTPVKGKR